MEGSQKENSRGISSINLEQNENLEALNCIRASKLTGIDLSDKPLQ